MSVYLNGFLLFGQYMRSKVCVVFADFLGHPRENKGYVEIDHASFGELENKLKEKFTDGRSMELIIDPVNADAVVVHVTKETYDGTISSEFRHIVCIFHGKLVQSQAIVYSFSGDSKVGSYVNTFIVCLTMIITLCWMLWRPVISSKFYK